MRQKRRDPSIKIDKKFYSDPQDECFTNLDPTQQFEQSLETDLADERLFKCFRSVPTTSLCRPTRKEVGKLDTLNLQALLRIVLKIPPRGKNQDTTDFWFAVMEFNGDGGTVDTFVWQVSQSDRIEHISLHHVHCSRYAVLTIPPPLD